MAEPPVSPNTKSWWKFMEVKDYDGEGVEASDGRENKISDMDDIDSVPGGDMSAVDIKLSFDGKSPGGHDGYESYNSHIREKSPGHVQSRMKSAQSQASRLKDRISKKSRWTPDRSDDEHQACDRQPSTAVGTEKKEGNLFNLLDGAVCAVETTLGSPTMTSMEATAQGWGLFNVTGSRLGFSRQESQESFAESDFEQFGTVKSRGTLEPLDEDQIEQPKTTQVNDHHEGPVHHSHSPSPTKGTFADEVILDEAIEAELADAGSVGVVARLFYPHSGNDSGCPVADLSLKSGKNDSVHSREERNEPFHTQGSADEISENSTAEQSSSTEEDEDGEEEFSQGSFSRPVSVAKILQPNQIPHSLSSLSEHTPVVQQDIFGDKDGLHKSCFGVPNIRKSKVLHSHSSVVKPNATASTMSSSTVTSGDNSTCSGATEIASRDDGSGFTKQRADNAHHAYTAFSERGGNAYDSLRLFEHPTPQTFPTLNKSELVVRVEFSTISMTDCKVRLGWYWGEQSERPLSLPIVPGVSFVGTVVQISKAASRSGLRQGDRVTSLVRVGGNSRHLTISKDRLVKISPDLKKIPEISCLSEIVLGAFQALHFGRKNQARYRATALAGKHVLVIDGASLHGSSLIELARAAGADSIYTTAKEKHHAALETKGALPLGLDPNYWFSLLEGRIDLVVGIANDKQSSSMIDKEKHLSVLNKRGQMVLISPPDRKKLVRFPKEKQTKVAYVNVFDSWDEKPHEAKRDLSHLVKLVEQGAVQPKILDVVSLGKVPRTQDQIERKKESGFILCNPWIPTKRTKQAEGTIQEQD